MLPDLTRIFASYDILRAGADALFQRVDAACPGLVACRKGCSDCCHALFDLSLVEAMWINQQFTRDFPHSLTRSRILERASEVDRKLTRAKRELFQAEKRGEGAAAVMRKAARLRMPCPLLNEDNQCAMYEDRPITCRLYGIPLAIGGESHVCGLSRFDRGGSYPTVQLGKIQGRLEDLSAEIQTAVGSRLEVSDVYVPLSMALLTSYDAAYFGLGKDGERS